jgi:cardiolipin synthase
VDPLDPLWAVLNHPAAFYTLEAVWILGISAWLLLERRSPVATIAWILALAVLPIVGIPVYFMVGPRRLKRKKLRMAMARRARALHLGAWERMERAEWQDPDQATFPVQLARLATRLDVAPAETAREVTLYVEGDACFDAMVEAIGAARHHVHAEFYIFRTGVVAERIREALVERARAGIEVRLLIDAAGSSTLPDSFLQPIVDAGGSIEWFNPILFGRLKRPVPNFRCHRKILVVDGAVGFTGGMNVSDDQSRAAHGDAAWRDTHVRFEGAAVHGLQLTFLEDWAFSSGHDVVAPSVGPVDRLRRFFPELEPGPYPVQVVASGPDQADSASESLYFAAIAGARRRVWLTTAYFVPSEPLLEALTTAALRGVDVQLLVPRKTDSRLADAAGTTFHDALLEAGARVYLYGAPMMHAKTCVVDDVLGIVGSPNFDNRSFRLNFEVLAAFYGGEPVEELAAIFEADRAKAMRLMRREGRGPFFRRLVASAARLMAPQL